MPLKRRSQLKFISWEGELFNQRIETMQTRFSLWDSKGHLASGHCFGTFEKWGFG
jgi:hypothetical protein